MWQLQQQNRSQHHRCQRATEDDEEDAGLVLPPPLLARERARVRARTELCCIGIGDMTHARARTHMHEQVVWLQSASNFGMLKDIAALFSLSLSFSHSHIWHFGTETTGASAVPLCARRSKLIIPLFSTP